MTGKVFHMTKYALCVESSHEKGMGHLFRALNVVKFISRRGEDAILIVNNDKVSTSLLEKENIRFAIADVNDTRSGWESAIIRKHNIDLWIDDRLDTSLPHAMHVKNENIPLVTLDDRGEGSDMADINFGALPLNYKYSLKGRHVLKGLKYLILNEEIELYRRARSRRQRILVSMGGSDTHGVTIKVLRLLQKAQLAADVAVGPCFNNMDELKGFLSGQYRLFTGVPSMARFFRDYDLLISGGGITPFEANASGLPCIIIANETHEVDNGRFLDKLGSSVFAGLHTDIDAGIFSKDLDIRMMSTTGLENIKTDGVKNMFAEIDTLLRQRTGV